MIGLLKGKVMASSEQKALILTESGVGYEVVCENLLLHHPYQLYISQIVRENAITLYGFLTFLEKEMFELLLNVRGVGPKSAFNLVSGLGPRRIIEAVQKEDKTLLKSISGVGPKAQTQIVLDLKNKISQIAKLALYDEGSSQKQMLLKSEGESFSENSSKETLQNQARQAINTSQKVLSEALLACEELGFSEEKIIPLAQEILKNQKFQKSDELLAQILKQMH